MTSGIYSMLQVYQQVTILVDTYLISTIYHQPLLYVVLQYSKLYFTKIFIKLHWQFHFLHYDQIKFA